MKLVTAIIQPFKLDDVREALARAGAGGATVTELRGYGRARGHTEICRGAEYVIDFVAELRVETVVVDERVDAVVDALLDAARTGREHDGQLFVVPLERAARVRTGEVDDDAL
jgi:nitrogen regulatory protein PII